MRSDFAIEGCNKYGQTRDICRSAYKLLRACSFELGGFSDELSTETLPTTRP
jgi:hypothetical protein